MAHRGVTVDAAQVFKVQPVVAPESFNIKDAGAAIIQLHEDGHSDLLSAAVNVTSASTDLGRPSSSMIWTRCANSLMFINFLAMHAYISMR